ncbi:Galactose-1-phosphate uridylyltransferase like protein [Verticillium longisporum]|uniref:Galactose-1-phosphate uridylyltransferase n=1 Tax=Verticillium longisporum TaxID=100787 RepID=A0A8I2Z891_VERLO|nr:Galactose-1-phosphate uridylyltransferase like protein [Verticillium longisporum]
MPDHILDDISHRRYNPLRGNWLLVSPHRTKRPWQGQKEEPSKNKLPEYDPACYLCPRNARAAGDTNPDYKKTLIFVNDYSAVKEEQAEYNPPDASTDLASSLLRAESATGRCYVLTFSPKHHLTLADMTPAEIVPVIEIWTQIYASHLDPASALAKQAAQLSLPAPAPEATITPPRAAGDTNPDYKKTLIFVNDYSAVKEEQAEYNPPDASTDLASSLLRAESATGRCYVLTFSPKHHLTLADMTPAEIVPVIEIWTQIYASHLDPASALAKQAAQLSLPAPAPEATITPPHLDPASALAKQAAQLSLPAPAPEATITPPKAQLRYMQIFENKGAAMGCSNPHPHGQIWTTSTIPEEPRAEMEQMAKYRAANAGRHLLADYVKVDYLHMHFYPPLLRSATVRKFLVGYELMAEAQRDITPEQAAARLRNCGGKLYRDQLE